MYSFRTDKQHFCEKHIYQLEYNGNENYICL